MRVRSHIHTDTCAHSACRHPTQTLTDLMREAQARKTQKNSYSIILFYLIDFVFFWSLPSALPPSAYKRFVSKNHNVCSLGHNVFWSCCDDRPRLLRQETLSRVNAVVGGTISTVSTLCHSTIFGSARPPGSML